jgi:hypothetical protein
LIKLIGGPLDDLTVTLIPNFETISFSGRVIQKFDLVPINERVVYQRTHQNINGLPVYFYRAQELIRE